MGNTRAAYYSGPGGPLAVDIPLYEEIASDPRRELAASFDIPVRSGRAWEVRAGQVCRVLTLEGPQVGDLNLWNLHNPRERLWASRTRQLQRAHVSTHDRLWSCLPYVRPMATITADTLSDYGSDGDGGRVHDLLGTRCDPYINQILTGEAFDYHCHSNLTRAVIGHGLVESDVHDVLNVFQCTGLNQDDEYFMKACPARPGDYFEFFAEQDLLCALSTCPGGDLSLPMWGPDSATEEEQLRHCHPIGVEVYSVAPDLLASWTPPAAAAYAGQHGFHAEEWAERHAGPRSV